MIPVDKDTLDRHDCPIAPGAGWVARASSETVKAIRSAGSKTYRFDPDIYRAPQVQVALRTLFFDKCAYCEYFLIRSDMNVDHFRPKGSVSGLCNHFGYYWLAYDWRNLLPACVCCNQIRRARPVWPKVTPGPAAGKGTSFPIKDESRRAYSPSDSVALETPLLLDPTVEDPAKHITFDPLGHPIGISKQGETSIAIYNLDTRLLNRERRFVIQDMVGLVRELKFTLSASGQSGRHLSEIEADIARKTESSAPYAGAARSVVKNPIAFGIA